MAESHPDSSLGEWRRRFLEPAGMGSVQAVGVAAALPLPQAAELYEEKLLATLREAAAAAGGGAAAAPKEEAVYCVECDVFIHDVLHNAPPATTSHHAAAADAAGGGGGGGGGAAAAAVPAIKDGGSDVG